MKELNKPNKLDKPDKQTFEWLNFSQRNWFSFLLFMAVALSSVMATWSKFNAHPDEIWHLEAGKYYEKYWLPPKIGDPRASDTYSVYGLSYLNTKQIVYIFAGKLSALLSPFIDDWRFRFRTFNVALFLGLAVFFLFQKAVRPAFIFLFITPQIWYVFSYFNGDAFPLFLSLIIVYQIVLKESLFRRYLDSPVLTQGLAGGALMSALVGLLLVSKLNFLIFVLFAVSYVIGILLGLKTAILVFLGGVGFWLNLRGWPPFTETKYFVLFVLLYILLVWRVAKNFGLKNLPLIPLAKFGMVLTVATTLLISWTVYDRIQNGTKAEKRIKIMELREKNALPPLKPSTPLVDKVIGHQLKAKGIPYFALFTYPLDWHKRAGKSASGVYGWMRIFGSTEYYVLYWIVFFSFLIFIFGYVIIKAGKKEVTFLLLIGLFIITLVYLITFHGWVGDFQAQGRHLFPAVGVMAAFLLQNQASIPEKGLSVFLIILYGLSVYSFVFVGLGNIPKIVF